MIVAIAGTGSKAGKSTFCKMFLKYVVPTDWQYLSTSNTLIQELSFVTGETIEHILEHKEEFREQLIKLSKDNPNKPLFDTLLKGDLSKHLLLESVRRKCEYDLLKSKDCVFIYIVTTSAERMKRGAGTKDINEVADCLIPYGEPARNCFLVFNSGSLSMMESRAEELANLIYERHLNKKST